MARTRPPARPVARPSPPPPRVPAATLGSPTGGSGAPPPGAWQRGGTVSTTSAQRFAAKVRSRRRRRIGVAAAGVALAAGAGWVALGSPWLRLQHIQVDGTQRLDRAVVLAAAKTQVGRPMVVLDCDRVASAVRSQRVVASVVVTRRWPSTIVVHVVERRPVAAVPDASGYRLMDPDGVEVARAGSAPPGLPVVRVSLAGGGAQALRATLSVLDAMPVALRALVATVGADSPDQVWLVLADGARVTWGGPEDTPLKSDVLRALLKHRARAYDVSAPMAPATSGTLAARR